MPNLRVLRCHVLHLPELRAPSSTRVVCSPRYYEPLRHPRALGLSLTWRPVGPVIPGPDHAVGLPRVGVRFPCVRAAATTLVQRLGVVVAHLTCRVSLPLPPLSGRPAHRPFRRFAQRSLGAQARTLAPSPICDPLRPKASAIRYLHDCSAVSGWSGCWVGLTPTGKRRSSRRTREPDTTDRDGDVAFGRKARFPRLRFDIHGRLEHSVGGCGFCHNFGTRGGGESHWCRRKGLVASW